MSVLEVQASNLVCSLYDRFRSLLTNDFAEGKNRCEALLVSISTQFSHSGYAEDGNTLHEYGSSEVYTYAHFILCGNVYVWSYTGPEGNPVKVPLEQWKNTSNHDSCWRSDGVNSILSTLYFDSCEKVQSHLPDEMRKAPKDVPHYNTMGRFMGSSIFSFIDIKFKRSDDNLNYRFELTDVKPSEKRLTLK